MGQQLQGVGVVFEVGVQYLQVVVVVQQVGRDCCQVEVGVGYFGDCQYVVVVVGWQYFGIVLMMLDYVWVVGKEIVWGDLVQYGGFCCVVVFQVVFVGVEYVVYFVEVVFDQVFWWCVGYVQGDVGVVLVEVGKVVGGCQFQLQGWIVRYEVCQCWQQQVMQDGVGVGYVYGIVEYFVFQFEVDVCCFQCLFCQFCLLCQMVGGLVCQVVVVVFVE